MPTAGLSQPSVSVTGGGRSTAQCSVVVHEETGGVQPDDRVADGFSLSSYFIWTTPAKK